MVTAKTAPAHPKYEVMINAAIVALKDRTGSSAPAIAKYIKANYKVGDVAVPLRTSLKRLATAGKLEKVKASFKLSAAAKNAAKPKSKKKPAVKKPTKKSTSPKKASTKKTTASSTSRGGRASYSSRSQACSPAGRSPCANSSSHSW